MAAFVERDRCPACGSGALKTLRSVDFAHPRIWTFIEARYQGRARRRELAERLYEVASCALCELSFQRYVLSEGALERLYEEWLPANAQTEARDDDLSALERHTRAEPERTRVLDLAAGSGAWSLAARAKGFDVVAVERSEARRKHLRELGLECVARVDDIARASVDYAHCDGIFEHLLEPAATLHSLGERLAPGGLAALRVPNASRATRDVEADYWFASDDALRPLEHVNAFTIGALRALGRAARLEEVAEATTPKRFALGRFRAAPLAIALRRARD